MNKQVVVVIVVIAVVALLAVAIIYAPSIVQTVMPHRPPQH